MQSQSDSLLFILFLNRLILQGRQPLGQITAVFIRSCRVLSNNLILDITPERFKASTIRAGPFLSEATKTRQAWKQRLTGVLSLLILI